jgi:hypothetical protein
VVGGEAGADPEGALAEGAAGSGENGAFGVVFLDEVFEVEEVFPGGRPCPGAVLEFDAFIEVGNAVGRCGVQQPGAVAVGVFDEDPGSVCGFEAAFFVMMHLIGQGHAEAGPVETEIGADAGVVGDENVVFAEELIDK